jgi:polyisoprenoid-binding protein YceI
MNPTTGTDDGLITIQANSGQSGNYSRDEKMRRDILQSGKYPEITFRPTQASGNFDFGKEEWLTADRSFHLHDADHPPQLRAHVIPENFKRFGQRRNSIFRRCSGD